MEGGSASFLFPVATAHLQWFLIIHLIHAVINIFGMWFVIEEHKLPSRLLEAEVGGREILWAVFEYIQPRYLILHSFTSFALQQFSPDFVQLQFKAYASKLAFLGQETFSAKIASLWVVLTCNHLDFVLYTGRNQGIWGSCTPHPYTGTVLKAFQSCPYQLLPAAGTKLVYMF